MLAETMYDKLNPMMKTLVDNWVKRLDGLPWQERSHLIADAGRAISEDMAEEQASLASRGFLTAILERLGEDQVDDPYQACLYLGSLHPEHQRQAEAFIETQPQLQAEMGDQLSSPF